MNRKIEKTPEELIELRRLYEEEGMTIEQISLDIGHSSQLTRRLLLEAGTTMRGVGSRSGEDRKSTEDSNAERRKQRRGHYLDPTASISKGNVSRMYR